MKPISVFLLMLLLGASTAAQIHATATKPDPRAAIEGFVVKDPGSEPVKKALIELIAENQTTGGDYTVITGADGTFRIEGIIPGRYRLFAERTGLLEKQKHGAETTGRLLTLTAGQELKDLQIRLQAAAVLRGRVTDEDGDPMANAQVMVLRQTFSTGRSRWEQAGSERSNDLGEYRVASLPPGNYYISVSPPPDFKSLIEASGKAADANLPKPAQSSYQPTYYPGTTDRSQAAPLQLHAGDDFPLNFSLTPGPSLSIRGSVVNLPPRSSASIMLQSRDLNTVLSGAEMHKDGSFIIRDVAPGTYTLVASIENSSVPMMARQSLQVGSNSVEGVRLAPQTGGWIRGRLRLESKSSARLDPGQFFLVLHPADGDEDALNMFLGGAGFSALTRVAPDGTFEWKNVPGGTYYVQLAGDAGVAATTADVASGDAGWFLKSAASDGRDVADSGINVGGGAVALDLIASAGGAVIDGIVADHKGVPVANAVIVAVPEPRLRGRVDRYRKTVSDQSGHFTLRGIPPGDYTLFSWESVEGEAYYDPEFLRSAQAQGIALRAAEGDHKSLRLEIIPDPEDQP
jgi:protocatechuate 3,4-dioxygenase beta subunit